MKKMLLLLSFVLTVSAQAACHEVVHRSPDSYPNPNPKVDELCIDQDDFVTFKFKGKTVYSFQAIFTVTPYNYRCGLGREGDRCGNIGSQMFLNYEDNRVSFEAHVGDEPENNYGAQYLEFDEWSYKFWVKGRR